MTLDCKSCSATGWRPASAKSTRCSGTPAWSTGRVPTSSVPASIATSPIARRLRGTGLRPGHHQHYRRSGDHDKGRPGWLRHVRWRAVRRCRAGAVAVLWLSAPPALGARVWLRRPTQCAAAAMRGLICLSGSPSPVQADEFRAHLRCQVIGRDALGWRDNGFI